MCQICSLTDMYGAKESSKDLVKLLEEAQKKHPYEYTLATMGPNERKFYRAKRE